MFYNHVSVVCVRVTPRHKKCPPCELWTICPLSMHIVQFLKQSVNHWFSCLRGSFLEFSKISLFYDDQILVGNFCHFSVSSSMKHKRRCLHLIIVFALSVNIDLTKLALSRVSPSLYFILQSIIENLTTFSSFPVLVVRPSESFWFSILALFSIVISDSEQKYKIGARSHDRARYKFQKSALITFFTCFIWRARDRATLIGRLARMSHVSGQSRRVTVRHSRTRLRIVIFQPRFSETRYDQSDTICRPDTDNMTLEFFDSNFDKLISESLCGNNYSSAA